MAGGKVLLSEGTFSVVVPVIIPSYTTLEGMGFSTILEEDPALPIVQPALLIGSAAGTGDFTDIAIRHLKVDGNSTNIVAALVSGIRAVADSVTRLNIEDVLIYDIKGYGAHLSIPKLVGCTFKDIFIDTTTNNGFEFLGAASEYVTAERIYVKGAGANGIYTVAGRHIVISECHVWDNLSSDGISIGGTSDPYDFSVVNCHVASAFRHGILVSGAGGAAWTKGFALLGNHCRDCGSHGMALINVEKATVVGNVLRDNTDDGLFMDESTDNTVSENQCCDNGSEGIHEWIACDNNDIHNNRVTGNGGAPIVRTGAATRIYDNPGSTIDGLIPDPGDGNAIPVARRGHVPLVTGVGGETRSLADAAAPGLTLDLYMKTDGGGNCVVTAASDIDQAGNNVMTFTAVGQYIRLVSIEDGADYEWRIAANDGVGLA